MKKRLQLTPLLFPPGEGDVLCVIGKPAGRRSREHTQGACQTLIGRGIRLLQQLLQDDADGFMSVLGIDYGLDVKRLAQLAEPAVPLLPGASHNGKVRQPRLHHLLQQRHSAVVLQAAPQKQRGTILKPRLQLLPQIPLRVVGVIVLLPGPHDGAGFHHGLIHVAMELEQTVPVPLAHLMQKLLPSREHRMCKGMSQIPVNPLQNPIEVCGNHRTLGEQQRQQIHRFPRQIRFMGFQLFGGKDLLHALHQPGFTQKLLQPLGRVQRLLLRQLQDLLLAWSVGHPSGHFLQGFSPLGIGKGGQARAYKRNQLRQLYLEPVQYLFILWMVL